MIYQAHNGPVTVGYAKYRNGLWSSYPRYHVTLPLASKEERFKIVTTKREVYALFKLQGAIKIRKRTL